MDKQNEETPEQTPEDQTVDRPVAAPAAPESDRMRVPKNQTPAREDTPEPEHSGTDADGNPVSGDRSVDAGDAGAGGDDRG